MVEQFCSIVSHHRDATARKATRAAITGPVGHDHASVETVIRILVRIPRVA
jgi:hypothetical protein